MKNDDEPTISRLRWFLGQPV